jgi:hypothetical protein
MNLLEGRKFNYHKQYLQSYKHNIPDHYVLGYNMVSYLREKTNDADVWEKITARSWRVPFIPFAFSNAIKNKTGMYVTGLYNEMADERRKQWQVEVDKLNLTSFDVLHSRKNKAYTDYLYPQPQPDGSVLAVKQGIGDIEQYVLLKEGKEQKVFTPGFLNDAGMLSAPGGIVVWNEFGFDPRWPVRNYSQLKAYDVKGKRLLRISDRTSRHTGAAVSPDGKKIVTVGSSETYQHRVLVLSFPDGEKILEFENPDNDFFSMARWDNSGNRIVALRTNAKGRSVVIMDPASGKIQEVIEPTWENIGHPVLHDNYLFFNSPLTGIDNVNMFDISTGQRYQVTTSKYGAYNPAVSSDRSRIIYNDQSRDGMNVVSIPFTPAAWKLVADIKPNAASYQHLVEQEGRPSLFDSIPKEVYPTRKFSKASHLINPFSWGTYVQNDLASIDIGVNSQDILSTTSIGLGYRYDLNERTGLWRAGVSYQGLYPIIDVEFTQGKRSFDEGKFRTVVIAEDTTTYFNDVVFKWTEQNISAGLRLPFNLTNSRYSTSLTLSNNVGYTHVTDFRNDSTTNRSYPAVIRDGEVTSSYVFFDYVGEGNLLYNHFSLSSYRLLKQSRRDINSKWGQALFVDFLNTPYGGDLEGQQFSATGYLFVPGFIKHHSIFGYAAYQQSFLSSGSDPGILNDYVFRNMVPIPRGHSVARFESFVSTSINYTLPVWYPDIAIGPILNIQRVKLNLFSDYAIGQKAHLSEVDENYHSVGGELTFDFNVFRFQPQFDIGVRYSYGLTHTFTNIELVIGTINF